MLVSRQSVWTLCCVTALAMAAPHALADKGPPSKSSKVEGTITAVDTTAMTVTIQKEKGGASVVVTVSAATKIEVNDMEPATLADVQASLSAATAAGDVLKGVALVNAKTKTASRLKAEEENEND
jgi:hypothetical protein